MAKVIPFRGIRYDEHKLGTLANVVTPPYDVISEEKRRAYHQRHPNSIIKLILGDEREGDDEENNKYSRAAATFAEWLEQGILTQDAEPSFYVYQQTYHFKDGARRKRRGFIGLVQIEDEEKRVVLGHERIFLRHKWDRLLLMRACEADLSPILTFYADENHEVDRILESAVQGPPALEFQDDQATLEQVWVLSDPVAIDRIREHMATRRILIADGHHRYETALTYRNQTHRAMGAQGIQPYDYVMMMLVNLDSEGLTIYPVHRLVRNLADFDPEAFKKELSTYFYMETFEFSPDSELTQRENLLAELSNKSGRHAFGMYLGDNQHHLLTLKDADMLEQFVSDQYSERCKELDVTVLHAIAIEHILGLTNLSAADQDHVVFTPYEEEAVQAVNNGSFQAAFFLDPLRIRQVKTVAEAGERLPHKSTYFYPKLLTGLVMYGKAADAVAAT